MNNSDKSRSSHVQLQISTSLISFFFFVLFPHLAERNTFAMALNQVNALAEFEKANQQRLKDDFGGKAGTKFVKEVQESMLFQYNWADLLSAAPTALSLLGACHVASSSEEASAIRLGADVMPKGGWKYLVVNDAPTLKACLVFVGDVGANAFTIAGSNMDAIAMTSGDLTEIVSQLYTRERYYNQLTTLPYRVGDRGYSSNPEAS